MGFIKGVIILALLIEVLMYEAGFLDSATEKFIRPILPVVLFVGIIYVIYLVLIKNSR